MKQYLITIISILSQVSCKVQDPPEYPIFRADIIGVSSFEGSVSYHNNPADSIGNIGLTITGIDNDTHDSIVIILRTRASSEEYIDIGDLRCTGYYYKARRINFVSGGVIFHNGPWFTGNFAFKTIDSVEVINGYFKFHL